MVMQVLGLEQSKVVDIGVVDLGDWGSDREVLEHITSKESLNVRHVIWRLIVQAGSWLFTEVTTPGRRVLVTVLTAHTDDVFF